jgi:hypothetical protein
MRRTTPSTKSSLIEPIGIGTGLVEASSSLWKRAAERASVMFGDMVRWAFEEEPMVPNYPHAVTGQLALTRRMLGIDGPTAVAQVYLDALRPLVESNDIEACTLRPFAGMLSEKNLLRRYKAWCPLCLISMKERSGESGVYEPLLWRLSDVTVCPEHNVDLLTTCRACGRRGDIVARYARVGCCGRCGAWQGKDEKLVIRRGDENEVRIARAVFGLLERTAEFQGINHDGRLTFKRLVSSVEMRDLLASALGVNFTDITKRKARPRLPRLHVLATIASVARAPLHQVILGELQPWTSASGLTRCSQATRSKPDWSAVGARFEQLANDAKVTRLKDACACLNISMGSARIYFPDLVERIVERGKNVRREEAERNKQVQLDRVRKAFRTLTAAGVYPKVSRLEAAAGGHMRKYREDFTNVINEEWARLDSGALHRSKRATVNHEKGNESTDD